MYAQLLAVCILLSSAFGDMAHSAEPRFPGFKNGDYGLGAILGNPTGFRYQRWLDWQTATFFDVGVSADRYMLGDANYSYYFFSEDDRWKVQDRVGVVMYSAFAGLTGGIYIGKDSGKPATLGARGGFAFEYLLPKSTQSLRAEIAPVIYLSGPTAATIQVGVAYVYYFEHKKKLKRSIPRPARDKPSSDPEFDSF